MRERAAEAVNSERRFQVLVDAVTDYAIYLLDPDGLITSWNSGAARLKGYSEAEVLGRSHAIFFTPEERAAGEPARALQTARARGKFEIEGWRVVRAAADFGVMWCSRRSATKPARCKPSPMSPRISLVAARSKNASAKWWNRRRTPW